MCGALFGDLRRLSRNFKGVLGLGVALLLVSACTRNSTPTAAPPTRVVNLAIWGNYLPDVVLKEFQDQTGIRVVQSNYSSNEELLAKMQAGADGYDVAVPSDYMISVMTKLNLLTPLDKTKIAELEHVDPQLLKLAHDPTNKFSLPYAWGLTGLAINRRLFKGDVKTYKALFTDPALKGKISLLDDVREVIGAALMSQGHSLNSKNPKELAEAQALVTKAKSNVKAFAADVQPLLLNNEVAVAQSYSTDALQASSKVGGAVEFVVPEDGCTLWIDNLVIPKGAKHLEEAHALINFLLKATTNINTVKTMFVAPANIQVRAMLGEEFFVKNPLLKKSPSDFKKCQMVEDLGKDLLKWDRAWTDIRSGEG